MLRKWIYKLRYILIIFSALLGILGLSSSFGYEIIENCLGVPYDGGLTQLGIYSQYSQCIEANLGELFIFNTDYKNSVLNGWNFKYYGSVPYNTFFVGGRSQNERYLTDHFIYWDSNGDLIGVSDGNYYNRVVKFKINRVCKYNGSSLTGAYDYCAKGLITNDPCMNGKYVISISDFKQDVAGINPLKVYYMYYTYGDYAGSYGGVLCLQYDGGYYCVNTNFREENSSNSCLSVSIIETGAANVGAGLSYYKDEFSVSPLPSGFGDSSSIGGGVDWGGISESDITNGMVIGNYEEMGFSKNICFAGVWSGNQLVSPPGTGLSVFDIFAQEGNNPLGFTNIVDWYSYYRAGFSENRNITLNSGSVFFFDGSFHMNLYNLFAIAFKNGVGNLFPSSDILEYCNLLLTANNNPGFVNDIYTGSLSDSDIRFIYNNYYTINYMNSGFFLDFSGTINSLSGDDLSGGFDDFFGDLSKRWNNALGQAINHPNVVGIIPNYILVFMFALIFIRILRK